MSWRAQLGRSVRELRFHLDGASHKGQATRQWLERNYAPLKQMNPSLQILVRESPNIDSTLYAAFSFGHERSISLNGLAVDDIDRRVELMADIAQTLPHDPQWTKRLSQEPAVVDADHEYRKWEKVPVRFR